MRYVLQRINTVAKILEHHHQKDIYPWYNRKRMDHYWRLWLPGSLGGIITINGVDIPLETDCIYIMPCYLQFSSHAEKPFSKFYIHFVPGELFHRQKELFKIPLNTFILQLTEQYKALYDAEPAGSRLCLIAHCILNWSLLQLPPGVLTKFQQRRTRRSTAFEYQRIFTAFQAGKRRNPAEIFPSEKAGICRRTSDNDCSVDRRDRRKNRFCQPLSLLAAICQTIRSPSGTLPELLPRPENMIYHRSRSHALSSAIEFSVSRTLATSSRSCSLWIILPGMESG